MDLAGVQADISLVLMRKFQIDCLKVAFLERVKLQFVVCCCGDR